MYNINFEILFMSAAFTTRNFRSRNWKEKYLSKFEYIAHVSTGTGKKSI